MGALHKRIGLAFLTIASACIAGCAPPAPPTASERVFIAHVSSVLQARFPTRKSAESRGYKAISGNLDSDNTYNLSDMDFDSVTLQRPNFLWYDRGGHLVGTDYELRKSVYPHPPTGYAVDPSRWTSIDEHVHIAYTRKGETVYEEHGAQPNLRTAHISAADLRSDGLLPQGAVLNWAMYHPAVWDLALWVVPNPRGAFADSNPLVK